MIEIEKDKVTGWEAAIRGMRNPKNSWDKSDSTFGCEFTPSGVREVVELGPNDLKLAKSLVLAGSDHSKFMRFIDVTLDITAPMYWWKEFDTYKVGTVRNSCSTMHKLPDKEFTVEDFSAEHLYVTTESLEQSPPIDVLDTVCETLNYYRDKHLRETNEYLKKSYWWQMIQLLPSSYNQRATIKLNYAVLRKIFFARRNHKLDEWHKFCRWIESLPYSELITAAKDKEVKEVISDVSLEGIDGYIHEFETAAEELRKVDCGELAGQKQKVADWLKDYMRLRKDK
jgi:hypothetical protein